MWARATACWWFSPMAAAAGGWRRHSGFGHRPPVATRYRRRRGGAVFVGARHPRRGCGGAVARARRPYRRPAGAGGRFPPAGTVDRRHAGEPTWRRLRGEAARRGVHIVPMREPGAASRSAARKSKCWRRSPTTCRAIRPGTTTRWCCACAMDAMLPAERRRGEARWSAACWTRTRSRRRTCSRCRTTAATPPARRSF